MKLVRFGAPGAEKPGLWIDGRRKDCSALFADWNREFFNSGGLRRLRELAGSVTTLPNVPDNVRWAPPVARPGKIVCIGLNYRDHAAETGAVLPTEPLIFMKATTALSGPNDAVLIPRGSVKTDYEIELAVVIGRDVRYLASEEEARGAIAGYALANDVSERHFQKERGGQMTKGKSCDTFFPLGPWLATSDEIADPLALLMRLTVNGDLRQSASSGQMVFGPATLVHYLSQFMTLEAGDVISTGTPAGVGLGRTPPEFLKAGDVLELSIEGLGNQRQALASA